MIPVFGSGTYCITKKSLVEGYEVISIDYIGMSNEKQRSVVAEKLKV